jgi:crotonobetainyl-CoA:carnitine CoA-transferase CaiB-like acyl-CoA transferase
MALLGASTALGQQMVEALAMIDGRARGPASYHSVLRLERANGLERLPLQVQGPSPALGEHSHDILSELGHSTGDIASLRESGVIR